MVSTIDQDLIPGALAEFHSALSSGKSDHEAWQFAISRVRYEVLKLAIGTCLIQQQRHEPHSDAANACAECVHELETIQRSFESEPPS